MKTLTPEQIQNFLIKRVPNAICIGLIKEGYIIEGIGKVDRLTNLMQTNATVRFYRGETNNLFERKFKSREIRIELQDVSYIVLDVSTNYKEKVAYQRSMD